MVSLFPGRERSEARLEKRISALRDDLRSLQRDLRGVTEAAGEHATSRFADLVDDASERTRSAASRAADQLGDWTEESLSPVRERVKSQPLRSVLLSIGAGALIGAILAAAPRANRQE